MTLHTNQGIFHPFILMNGQFNMPIEQIVQSRGGYPIFSITLEYSQEDNVWSASCDDIPGLNIEGDTEQEAKSEALKWAPELLMNNNIVEDGAIIGFTFHKG